MKERKILQCVYSLNRGGVETWLMHVLRNIDRTRFKMDFLVHTPVSGDYDEEAIGQGCRILTCVPPSRVFSYSRIFRKLLEANGEYDVVHSHDAVWSGPALRVAANLQVPVRIAHSHNDVNLSRPKGLARRLVYDRSIALCRRYATHGLACSAQAAESSFGKNWQTDTRYQVLHCGLDFSAFGDPSDGRQMREQMGIPAEAFVVGHTGSFREPKNHKFLIQVFRELRQLEPNAHLLLVGHGVLEPEIRRMVDESGLASNVTFAGSRDDVPGIMTGCMDVFVFPSIHEGLGLALVEAQAAGLPCYISDSIPRDADVVDALVHRMSLESAPQEWAERILEARQGNNPVMAGEALQQIEKSPFSINSSLSDLVQIYDSA